MTEFERTVLSRGDEFRLRIATASEFIKRLPPDSFRAKDYQRMLALYEDILVVVEKHERIAQLARVLATECA